MAFFPFETFVAAWEFLTGVTYFSVLMSSVNLKQNFAVSLNLCRMDLVLVSFLYLSDWLKIDSKKKTRICLKFCYLNLSDQPKRNFYSKWLTLYFSLFKCHESEVHVISQMTALKNLQLSVKHAHGSYAARAIPYSPELYVFQNWCFFARFYSGFYFSYDTRVMSKVVV